MYSMNFIFAVQVFFIMGRQVLSTSSQAPIVVCVCVHTNQRQLTEN